MPKYLPDRCPSCNLPLGRASSGNRKLQKKAIVLLLVGVLVTVPWAMLMFALVDMAGVIARNVAALALFGAILALPALGFGKFALSLPKVFKARCPGCRWHQTFLVRRNGEIVQSDFEQAMG